MNTRYTSIRRRVLGIRLPIVALLLIVDAALVWRYYADNEYFYELSREFISDDQSPSEMAVSAVDYLRARLRDTGEPGPFLSPAFEFLRPPPREVAERGGDCADRSRLLITLLNLRGVRASKMALYDHEQRSRHAVVTIDIESDKEMVVDALFGLYFPKPSGGYYGVGDLTKDEGILRDRIEQEIAGGEDGFRPRLKKYPYEQYTYAQPRSINWEKSFAMRAVYRLLKLLIGEAADRISRPAFVERPVLMLLYASVSVQALLLVTYVPGSMMRLQRRS